MNQVPFARRNFIQLALSSIPATGLMMGCEAGLSADSASFAGHPAVAAQDSLLLGSCDDTKQRERWLQLHAAYVGRQNQHDLPGILECFAPNGSMLVNDRPFQGRQSIADLHASLGMSDAAAGLVGTQVIPDREYFTDHELLIQGRVLGMHLGTVLRFPATLLQVELHYAALYRFDERGKLASERMAINWAPLAGAL
jgi:hypothetical protein